MALCYHLYTQVLLVKRRPADEGNSLIDTLISVCFFFNLFFPGFRNYVLIIENTEKHKENIIHECITKHVHILIYFPFN